MQKARVKSPTRAFVILFSIYRSPRNGSGYSRFSFRFRIQLVRKKNTTLETTQ